MGYWLIQNGLLACKMGCTMLVYEKIWFWQFPVSFYFFAAFFRFVFATFGPKTVKMSCLLIKLGYKLVK